MARGEYPTKMPGVDSGKGACDSCGAESKRLRWQNGSRLCVACVCRCPICTAADPDEAMRQIVVETFRRAARP